MLEYIFFDHSVRDKFCDFLARHGVEFRRSADEEMVVEVAEDIDEALSDAVDHHYELLLQETAELMEEGEDALEKNVAGVQITLSSGEMCTIRLEPQLVSRMLQCLSMEELRDLVQHIADGVENPDNRPLCHV